MIELKNISKTYKAKRTKKTKVLDDISLTLSDKGMTFILGKSGSGKSTLLNILGGLDKYDSGDMLILGKSSKSFSQADFDSYRNTYLGFVFQEFNILEDYDVYENISLALQLQHKKIDEKEINSLLDRLELTDLKKRKINELSGGQKQRVAIARALIKNPKIILADEPTGNLDSKTGKQVMELLKEISKEKLVVIVSHDEDYAREYADRIIEIKDGKIINDTNEIKSKESNNEYKIIKSKLPIKESFKLGIGSLKHKKIKLFFTIILTICALGFFSCADTLSSYDINKQHADILTKNGVQYVEMNKQTILKGDDGYDTSFKLFLTDEDIDNINKDLNRNTYNMYSIYNTYNEPLNVCSLGIVNCEDYRSIKLIETNNSKEIFNNTLIGRDGTNSSEIVISSYLANMMIEKGINVEEEVIKTEFKTSNTFKPTSYEDIINSNYTFYLGEDLKVKIVGILNDDNSRNIYVSEEFIKQNRYEKNTISSIYSSNLITDGIVNNDYFYGFGSNIYVLDEPITYYDGSNWVTTSTLNKNEVILNIEKLTFNDNEYQNDLSNYISSYNQTRFDNYYSYSYDDLTPRKKFIANYINEKDIIGNHAYIEMYYSGDYSIAFAEKLEKLTVIGVYDTDIDIEENNKEINYYETKNYVSRDLIEKYMGNSLEKDSLLVPMNEKKDFLEVGKKYPLESELSMESDYSETILYEGKFFKALNKIILVTGLIFLGFTIILIMSFMVNSISYRKKEIGVLRALGARSLDIMKIFLWEGICLSIISGTVASILLVIVSNFLNTKLMDITGMLSQPFMVGVRQFIVIYVLVFAVNLVSSIIPIRRIARMKPIDAILNK